MRTILFSTAVVLLTLIAGSTALACDCITPPPNESFRRATFVFEGEVVRITGPAHNPTYTFRVSKLLKGSPVSEVTIEGTGTNCDAYFSPDFIYRVYAHSFKGKLISSQCSGNKILQKVKVKRSHTGMRSNSLLAQDDENWPSLSYLRSDYRAVAVVAHIRIQEAEITSRIVGYENWKVIAVVLESFKGKFKKGDVIQYFHGAEAGFKREYFTGEKIVFLLADRGPKAEFPYTVLENSTLSHTPDRVRKLRLIRRSYTSKRRTATRT